jgi:uncharacterized protein (TIGR02099 family)
VLLTHVPDYRDQIQAWVNETTRLDVRFRDLDARLRVFGPEIYITAVEVYVPGGGPLLAESRAASIGVDLWRVLFQAELLAGRLRLIEPEIGLVRTLDGRIELEGQAALGSRDGQRQLTADDLPTGRLDIENARLTFTDLKGELRDVILSAVDMTVRRNRNDLDIDAEIMLPEGMGSMLEISGSAHGALDEPAQLDWRVVVRAREIELAGWREQFAALANLPIGGNGNLRLDAAFTGRALDSAKLRLQLAEVVLPATAASPAPTRYPVIAGDFDLRREASRWRFTGRDLEVSTATHRWEPSALSATWEHAARRVTRIEANATVLRLDNLVPLAGLAPATDWRNKLIALSPEGEVRALTASYARRGEGAPQMSASARFVGLGFNPLGKAPGIQGLNGLFDGNEEAGYATLDSAALQFTMPQKFRAPLSADLVRGRVDWTRDAGGWHFTSRQFELRNAHASAASDVELTIPGNGASPVLQLRSSFRDAVLAEGWRYLPVDRLKDRVLAWLDGAFIAGRAPRGELVFSGPTKRFPFRDGDGEFRIAFPVEGLTLNYAERWPRLENAALEVEFHNAGLTSHVRSGTLNGLAVESATAKFADFKEGDLAIKGRIAGDVGATLGFLRNSPLGARLGATFLRLRGAGPAAMDVDLQLPIKHLADRHYRVATRLDSASLALADSEHSIEGLTGTLLVDDKRISSTALAGSYLGGPIDIELAPASASSGELANILRLRAETPAAALMRALGAPSIVRLDGRIAWDATVRIPNLSAAAPLDSTAPPATLRVDSSLRGTSVDLPAPLAKSRDEIRPIRVDAQWSRDGTEALVRAAYGSDVRSQLRFARQAQRWTFDRGSVHFGAGEARLPAVPGLELRGTVDELDLSQWLALRPEKPGKRALSDYLKSASITARQMRLFGFGFSEMSGSLIAGERAWSISIDGPRARGIVLVPYDLRGPEPLVVNMTRLTLAVDEPARDDSEREPDPRQWPNVSASIGEFTAWGRRLGFLRAEMSRTADGVHLDSFSSQSSTFAIQGSGAWLVTPQGQQSSLKLELNSTDVLQTMGDLGYGDSIIGKRGNVVASVTWPGAPNRHLLARLDGNVTIQIDDGQLVAVQPGAGRIFGLMSVAALPRRLSLDFTDFTDKGLAFDTIRGDFTLKSGDAFTDNLLLKGPAAEIGVVGRAGLGQRDYDQTAVVTGSLGQSLPVAGVLAGGPVVGAALLVFSQIFKEPLKGIARGYYRITGTWEDPVVQRVDDSDRKKAENTLRTAEQKTGSTP